MSKLKIPRIDDSSSAPPGNCQLFTGSKNPRIRVWGVISGGVLGLGALVRFNPIAILPIVLECLFGLTSGIYKR